jgi:hypothetical protein
MSMAEQMDKWVNKEKDKNKDENAKRFFSILLSICYHRFLIGITAYTQRETE